MDESHEIYQIKVVGVSFNFKFCPICGSANFIGDSDRSFVCEECTFHYFINNSAAVACLIINQKGDILLTRRAYEPNKGKLDLPGGFVDPMESAEMAVKREIKEELNLDVDKMNYLISFPNLYPFSGIEIPTADLAFYCVIHDLTKLIPGDDVESVEFIAPDQIDLESLCSESMRQIIRYYLESIKE